MAIRKKNCQKTGQNDGGIAQVLCFAKVIFRKVWFWAGLCKFRCFVLVLRCSVEDADPRLDTDAKFSAWGCQCTRCVLFGVVWFLALCQRRCFISFTCFALVSAALAAFCLALYIWFWGGLWRFPLFCVVSCILRWSRLLSLRLVWLCMVLGWSLLVSAG